MTTIGNLNPSSMVLLFGKKKKTEPFSKSIPEKQEKSKPNPKAIPISKYSIEDGFVNFSSAKGLFKKRWVTISELPITEIEDVESFGNQISITRNGTVYLYVHKRKTQTFSELRQKILDLIAEQQKTSQSTAVTNQIKAELAEVMKTAVDVVDLSFDVLLGLHEKRVNWQSLDAYSDKLVGGVRWTGKTLPPLKLELSKISDGIKKQEPKEVSQEALRLLKAVYGYFNGLLNIEDTAENSKVYKNAKNAMATYLTVNDVLFAKVTGQKDDPEEFEVIEIVLSQLTDASNAKDIFNSFAESIQKTSAPGIKEDMEDARAIFRMQLSSFL